MNIIYFKSKLRRKISWDLRTTVNQYLQQISILTNCLYAVKDFSTIYNVF